MVSWRWPIVVTIGALLLLSVPHPAGQAAAGRLAGSGGWWYQRAPLPEGRGYLAAATGPDGRIYAIGGLGRSNEEFSGVEAYDPHTDTWSTVEPLPTTRSYLAAAAGPDGRIYAIGGNTKFYGTTSAVDAYDVNANSWTPVAPLPGTWWPGFAAVTGPDGRIYVMGGINQQQEHKVVEAYDVHSNSWTAVAPLPEAQSYLAAAVGSDGRIYAIGGIRGTASNVLATVQAYDLHTNSWSAVAPLPTGRANLVAATGQDGRIYAIGGSSKSAPWSSEVDAYDARTNSWSPVSPMLTGRAFLAAATDPVGRIYAIGGQTQGSGIAVLPDVEAYDLYTPPTPWPTDTPRPRPYPTRSPTRTPAPSIPSLTLDGIRALDARGRSHSVFRPGASGYTRVRWTIRHLQRPSVAISIARYYYVPRSTGWQPLPSVPVTKHVVPSASNGTGYEDARFVAPVHYRAYRIVARILFQGQWSNSRSVTIQTR